MKTRVIRKGEKGIQELYKGIECAECKSKKIKFFSLTKDKDGMRVLECKECGCVFAPVKEEVKKDGQDKGGSTNAG